MRRVLLGGLGLALGVFGGPALAQDSPARPAPPADPPARAARLGRPVALPDSSPAGVVTPAGLVARGQVPTVTPVAQPAPPGYPVPVPAGTPLPMVVAQPGGSPLPLPRKIDNPTLTEIRGPVRVAQVDPVPSPLPAPTPFPGPGFPVYGVPGLTPGAALVPSVGPAEIGTPCPQPCLDAPLCEGACPTGRAAAFPALGRLLACRGDQSWAGAEYLLWWTRSAQLPTLVTTSAPADNGILGRPSTQPLLAGSFGDTLHGGFRFTAGHWFGDEQRRGVDTRFLFLFRNGAEFAATTGQYPVLARPFFNVNAPVGPFAEVIAAPGLATGGVVANLENSLWGAEVNYRRFLAGNPCARLDGLVGYRYLNFKEQLSVTETFVRTAGSPLSIGAPAVGGVVNDRFRAENNFHGGQIGLTGEVRRGRWFVDGRGTIAFGTVRQTAEIAGGQLLMFPDGGAGLFQGGLLALPGANIGRFSQDKFAVLPEVGLNLGYHVTTHCRVFVGYNFLYLSSVVRPGGLIDPALDAARIPNFPLPGSPAVLPGPPRPSPLLRTTDLWAQGINFGVQWTW